MKNRPLTGLRFQPDLTVQVGDDLPAGCQTDARAAVFLAGVQALEHLKNAVVKLRVDADAIVGDRKMVRLVRDFVRHPNDWIVGLIVF